MTNTIIALLVLLVSVLLVIIFYLAKKIYSHRIMVAETKKEIQNFKDNVNIIAENKANEIVNQKLKFAVEDERKRNKDLTDQMRRDFGINKKKEIEQLKQTLEAEKKKEMDDLIKKTREETSNRQRAVLKGKIGEQIAPLLEEFYLKYDLADARFIGQPVDYIIFKNLTRYKDEITTHKPKDERCNIEIIIADIKSGKSQLNTEQREIRDAVLNKRFAWDEIRIDIPEETG